MINLLQKNRSLNTFKSRKIDKIIITLSIIFLYRLGSTLPLPDINYELISPKVESQGIIQSVLGGSFGFFALGISPYITASFIIQFLTPLLPSLEKLQQEEGENGRARITQLMRILALIISGYQAFRLVFDLKKYIFNWNILTVSNLILLMMTGTIVCIWFSELLTEKGLGNGTGILIFVNVLEQFPIQLTNIFNSLSSQDNIAKILFGVGFLLTLGLIIVVQSLIKEIDIISSKQFTSKFLANEVYSLPFRVNQSAVMSIVFASTALYYLTSFIYSILNRLNLSRILALPGNNLFYIFINFGLIIIFNVLYSTVSINPRKLGDNLRKMSATIPNIQPGKPTAQYLNKVLTKVFLVGGIITALLVLVFDLAFLSYQRVGGLISSLFILIGTISDVIYKYEDDKNALDLQS